MILKLPRQPLATIGALLACVFPAFAQELKLPEERPAKAAVKKDQGPLYVRIHKNDQGEPQGLQTPVIRFVPTAAEKGNLYVDLIGAVHVGEKSYYEELNKRFADYEVVLYELVAPPGKRPPKGGDQGVPTHPIAGLQVGMKSMLELEHQLEHVDYTRENFVHADMSPTEFEKSMKDRGESFTQMFLRAMGQGLAKQPNKEGGGDIDLLFALFAKDRARKLKLAMAEQLLDLDGQMALFEGDEGSTIITQRNRKAFEVLRKEIDAGRKKIGVFYGAGHFPDMEQRLKDEFQLRREKEEWLTAWNLAAK
jgi:hypothetical protein